MAQEPPAQDLMNYEAMAQDALRGVVRAALLRAGAPGGLPGAHHFYLTFKTGAAGVEGPEELLSRYPDEMTIVLQHQFWDLEVGDQGFGVTLKFGGRPQSLVVPYAALTRFYDPSVQFLLQFEAEAAPEPKAPPRSVPSEAAAAGDAEVEAGSPNVVSLDHFRKK
ncbi:MAG: SspB family protein [Phenylobacterium sp.]